jgi:hypothetical protein
MGIGRYHSITTFAFQRSKKKQKQLRSFRCSTWIRYQKNYILVSGRMQQKLSSQCNVTAQIDPVQDNNRYFTQWNITFILLSYTYDWYRHYKESTKSKRRQALLPKYHNTKSFHSKKNLKSSKILFEFFVFPEHLQSAVIRRLIDRI